MDTAIIKRSWVAMLLLVTLGSCEKDTNSTVPVVSDFKANPVKGLTTSQLNFDATNSLANATEEDPVLVRYDWQSDGIWDQDYTTNKVIQHRFLKPGSYRITMEARNMFGVKDTSSTTVEIVQGYSPPVANLAVLPDTGNVYVLFTLDASRSYDDEDSSCLLKYRWDFDGDGSWDTEYSPNAVVTHAYPTIGLYNAEVEVVDPTNRSAVMKKRVVVNMLNDSIVPKFTIDGGFCSVTDTFHCDASATKFLNRPDKKLTYSWDVYNDGYWDVTGLPTPFYPAFIRKSGKNKIKLRVTDDRGLYMEVIDTVKVFERNNPPVPVLTLARRIGNSQSEFVFNCYGTADRETQIMDLKYDWDVDGDGQWEPEFHNLREISCKYPKIGKYKVILRVTDTHDDFAVISDSVQVYAGQHETGVLIDRRDMFGIRDYYGTVKIGTLWWMQENCKIVINPSKDIIGLPRICYGGKASNCNYYGGLYTRETVNMGVCPGGWRLPTKAEFGEMIKLEAPNSISSLLQGGSSELFLLMGGYIDATGEPVGLGTSTHYWLSDKTSYGSPTAWYINTKTGESRSVVVSNQYGFSVRCVKSE